MRFAAGDPGFLNQVQDRLARDDEVFLIGWANLCTVTYQGMQLTVVFQPLTLPIFPVAVFHLSGKIISGTTSIQAFRAAWAAHFYTGISQLII